MEALLEFRSQLQPQSKILDNNGIRKLVRESVSEAYGVPINSIKGTMALTGNHPMERYIRVLKRVEALAHCGGYMADDIQDAFAGYHSAEEITVLDIEVAVLQYCADTPE